MTSIVIKNGLIVTMDNERRILKRGNVAIQDGEITSVEKEAGGKHRVEEVIDATGKVVMPGLICTHHHLYSTFARGMAIPGEPAKNFVEILEKLWWKLDNALTKEDIYYSSLVPLIECVRNGTTTIIDHHESQSFQRGSLDEIARAVEEVGIRASLCFGTSDRYGKGQEGLKENERFLSLLKSKPSQLVKGMVGLHAAFTVNDDTLDRSVQLAKKFRVGIHVHCAEDKADQDENVKKYNMRVIERLNSHGALGEKSIAVHCVHINEKEMDTLKATGTNVVHNPESNMNNAVGCADVLGMMRKGIEVGLGTDGMNSDMLAQMRCAYLLHRHVKQDPRVAFLEAPAMLLENNPKIVQRATGWSVGKIESGAPADIILVDYLSPTILNENNFLGHLIFGLVDATVDTTICNGKILMHDKKLVGLDEKSIAQKTTQLASELWRRF
ncbi:MAG: putative aminohydrolase SsnA [Candidatus Hadarchaeota archaeon]